MGQNSIESKYSKNKDPMSVQDLHLVYSNVGNEDKQILVLDNISQRNKLSNYSVRPEYSFDGTENIYKLPALSEMTFINVGNRKPNIEVDVFLLTDPTDASSSVLWLNGTNSRKCFLPDPKKDYYLVVDGFAGKEASLEVFMELAGSTRVCETTNTPIDLNALLTMGLAPDGVWFRNSGSGGDFDYMNGTYNPFPDGTSSIFTYQSPEPYCDTEEVIVTLYDCTIPTIGQWGYMILLLIFLIMGVAFLSERKTRLA